jgi:hypothetical protein
MNIITNLKLIRRYTILAQAGMLGGLAVLAGGMFLSFKNPARADISLIALFLGFLLSQVGIYHSNHYARRPRPDELLNQALKGLDGRYTLYHYSSPVSHLLVGPSGIWILMPRFQRGEISFVNNEDVPEVQAALIFTHPSAKINISEDEVVPAATVTRDQLKDMVRKSKKNKGISPVTQQQVLDLLPKE